MSESLTQHLNKAARATGALLALGLAVAAMPPANAQNPATSVAVDANANHRAINPNIYGVSFGAAADLTALNAPLNRSGGNAETRYNWQLNSDNRAQDWYYESIPDASSTPGERRDTFFSFTKAAGAQTMETIPMIPYIGTLGPSRGYLWSFSVSKYGPQTGTDAGNGRPDAGNSISTANGNPHITGNNPLDANVANSAAFQLGWVQHMKATWGAASAGGLKYYLMDNESGLWQETHRDVKPTGATMDEIYNDIVAYAADVKNTDSSALVVGPEEWGWAGYFSSPFDKQCGCTTDRNNHGGMDYMPWLLQNLKSYDTAHGTKSLDVFSLHWYPQSGEYSTDDSVSEQLIRNKSTRSLWDPNYTDISWVNTQVQLIPRMKNWVATYYPGLQTGITEYNWGDETQLNGATTQADIYGIFGREGLDMSTRWTVPPTNSPAFLAMKIYRNYDGNKSTFGDTSCYAGVANPDNLSAFAATRASDNALTVMVINKITGSTPVTVSLANFATTGTAHAYQISSAAQTSITQLADVAITSNSIVTTVPSQSVTLFVVPHGSTISVPTAPTGLAATVGSGTVNLTWIAAGGATSYTVKRSTVSGSGYANAGTVTSPAPCSFSNTGLTNGTAYYYVVTGTNSAGTSPNSAELAATPIVPPTFTSSATASPSPVNQGSQCTVTATVTDTANTLTNGNVQVNILNPSGAVAATQTWTGQNFTLNQQHQYVLPFTASAIGTYSVQIGVFSATYQLWNWNNSAVTITSNSTTTFNTSAMANPATVTAGANTTITLSITETGVTPLTNGLIDLEVVNSGGTQVLQNTWTGQNINQNQTVQYPYTWTTPTTPGVYTIHIGVFGANWSPSYSWNANGGTITVNSGSGAPPAPTGLTATAGNAQVALSWNASSGATAYDVKRSTVNGSGYAVVSSPTTTSYTNTGLTNGTTYYFVVDAKNASGTSGNSNQASATPSSGGGGSAVIQIACGDTSAVPPFIADTDFGTGTKTFSVSTTITTTGVTNPAPMAVYQFERASDGSNGGAFSYTIPGLTANAPYTVRLHFAEIFYSTAGNRTMAVTINGTQVLTNFDIFTAAGGEFKANVQQFSTNANGSGQIVLTFGGGGAKVDGIEILNPSPPPSAPTGLTATPGNGQVALTWNASTGATAYDVKRSTVSGSGYATVSSPTATNYTSTGLTNGTTYYFVVDAKNANGTSGNSSQVSATPSASQTPVLQINCGGSAASPFIADTDFGTGTKTFSVSTTITTTGVTNPAPLAVYQTERASDGSNGGAYTYTLPGLTANAAYTVRLHFAEIFYSTGGNRSMTVTINGTQVLTKYDIFNAAGGEFKAIVPQFSTNANGSGQIVLTFGGGGAKIDGIEVLH